MSEEKSLVLFDGICNLCSAAVQFIMKRDRRKMFLFASLQSERARELLKSHGFSGHMPDTIVLIEENSVYLKSTAVLRILKLLGGAWKLLYGFKIIPVSLRDSIYDWIAGNRFKWFGKRKECYLPEEGGKERILK